MSVIITRSLQCDADDCPNWILEVTDTAAQQLREEAARHGWTYRKGHDHCPQHSEESAHG